MWIVCAIFCATAFYIFAGLAQAAAPITPSGLNTQVNLSTSPPTGTVQYDITGGTRAGTNLFHSFGEFNVPNNTVANFLNTPVGGVLPSTSNILGRVTGDNPSSIFGTIQTTGFGSANLFLMNPSGIVFGPGASLNVGGSVTFTTADYLRLDKIGGPNAGIFHADPTQVSLLTSASVDAFGFLGTNPAAITVQGSKLTVPEEHGISLIGGNITIQNGTLENGTVQTARLSAPNGQINLATAKSPGAFLQDLTAAPNINSVSFRSFGSAHLEPGSTVDVSQTGNGKVSIRGGELVLEIQNALLDTADSAAHTTIAQGQDTIHLAPESAIISQTSSTDPGPDIHLKADRITLLGIPGSLANIAELPFTGIGTNTQGAGNAGNIILQATRNIETKNPVQLMSISSSNPDGSAGSPTRASGNAGNVELTSTHGDILMTEGGRATFVFSQSLNSSGSTGNVITSAPEGTIVLKGAGLLTSVDGVGGVERTAGQVSLTAKNLQMQSGMLSNETIGRLKPGGIMVVLSGTLRMEADSSLKGIKGIPTNSLIVTSAFSPTTDAPAGDIALTAKDIAATQGSLISSETFAAGPGGHLKIFTDTLQLKDGSQIKSGSTFAPPFGSLPRGVIPTGAGGDITVQTVGSKGSILIDGNESGIFTNTQGTGSGGAINLTAKTLTIQNSGTISASTTGTSPRATGGSIIVNAADQVTLTGSGTSITASTNGPGNAGNILVKANDIALNGGATITASSTGSGKAGSVTIQGLQSPANSFLIDGPDSGIFTNTTKSGAGGDITVSSNSIQLRNNGRVSAETSGMDLTATGGKIRFDGGQIRIENGALVTSSSTGIATGGNIALTAGQSVTIQDGGSITASSTGAGNAGNISIDAGQQLDVRNSPNAITTEATKASGGNIDIRAIDHVRFANSQINASVGADRGNGGNITIDPNMVVLHNSQIRAGAVQGRGGDITITTPLFLRDPTSIVDASSLFGLHGFVVIRTPTSNLSGTVAQLASKTAQTQALLQSRCVASAGGEQSTFIVAGRDALPSEPGGWLSSPLSMDHLRGHDAEHAAGPTAKSVEPPGLPAMVVPVHETQAPSLRRLMPPGLLVRTFGIDRLTGCRS